MKESFEVHKFDNPRLYHFYGITGLLVLILIVGLGWRQLVKKEDYLEQEEQQSLRRILQPAPRGEIYDRNGELLVGNRPIFTVAVHMGELRHEFRKEYFKRVRTMRDAGVRVNRDKLKNEARYQVLQRYVEPVSKILGRPVQVESKELEKHFTQRLLLPMPILKDISIEEYAKLTEQLPVESPIQVMVDSARYYPYGSLAAHVIGYVGGADELDKDGVPGDHLKTFSFKGKEGKRGVEKSFNEHLQGNSGGEIWLVDPAGFQYQSLAKKVPEKGDPLTLSIDIDIQSATEDALKGRRGAVVAIEVKTGEVLAMASSPTFDLNDLTPYIPSKVFKDINDRQAWLDRSIQGFYPPASPFKLVTATAGLRHGIMRPEEMFTCDSGYLVGNRVFPEHDNIAFGLVDLKRAIQVSSNVYFYPIALSLGPERLAEEARMFGLHKQTGIELPYEGRRMTVPDPEWKLNKLGESWRGGDTANMSMGQGYLLATPLQMACLATAFARQETRIQPTLIHKEGNTGNHPESQPLGISDLDYKAIVEGMEICGRSGKHAKVPGMSLAAKTGTGQSSLNNKYVTTPCFLGFAPAEDPQIAIVVLIEGDDRSLWGGTTAGPIAHVVLSTYYQKYILDKEQ